MGGTNGLANNTITSNSGNVSSDSTCSSYFNNIKDQNNLTNLGLTVAPLTNNGGLVPTRALLQGSPAIDSGVTIPTLIQDARGSVRPQGLAYDSGAYESPFTTASTPALASNAVMSLASTGQSRTLLTALTVFTIFASASVVFELRRRQTS